MNKSGLLTGSNLSKLQCSGANRKKERDRILLVIIADQIMILRTIKERQNIFIQIGFNLIQTMKYS